MIDTLCILVSAMYMVFLERFLMNVVNRKLWSTIVGLLASTASLSICCVKFNVLTLFKIFLCIIYSVLHPEP